MDVLGLITARGGSKSLPGKNLAPLGGKSLLAHTCAAARASRRLSRLVLSTDDAAIAEEGRRCGADVPFLRPAELARDDTPSIDVALHVLQQLQQRDGWRPQALMILQPTSPFRSAQHIDDAIELLERSGADTVVSVVEVPHRFSPYSVLRLEQGRLTEFWKEPVAFDRFRRQSLPKLYARNGPVVLVSRTAGMAERRSFYGPEVEAYVMSEMDSVDIDVPFDLLVAQAVLAARQGAAAAAAGAAPVAASA
jgi:CMP-N-acetylneuraminic acid synthetase